MMTGFTIADIPIFYLNAIRNGINHIIEDLAAVAAGEAAHLDLISEELLALKNLSRLVGIIDFSELCHLIQEFISRPATSKYSGMSEKVDLLIDAGQYFLAYINALDSGEEPPAVPDELLINLMPPTLTGNERPTPRITPVFENQGAKNVFASNNIRIRLPQATSHQQCNAIIASLKHIFDGMDHELSWVVDLSAFRKLPISLFVSLMACQKNVQRRGRQIELVGVNPNLLPTNYMKKLAKNFKIQESDPLAEEST
jgi:hypothetical protein